ncbi:unnamed protein product [Echinostoma caproni]|uniref:Centrosomal protein of 162 kDa n=1 Tax=Echinostoma caproni TaxID=27848 RepID=A0A183A6D1_9TREM|nr:unnamed protein product [Echinostoma caproni]
MQGNILSAKADLEQLNSRLAAYVHRVRQLKDENDIKDLKAAITVLEDDLRSLKASYECQINHLSSSIRILTEEKHELQKELLAHKETDAHFMDRGLKSDLSDYEREISTLKLRIRQLQLEAGDGQSAKKKLIEELHDLKQKQRLGRMRSRLDWYIAQFAANDARMQEVAHKEATVPEILLRLRKTARDEIRKHQEETKAYFKKTVRHPRTDPDIIYIALVLPARASSLTRLCISKHGFHFTLFIFLANSFIQQVSMLQSQLVDERKRNRFLKMESYQSGQQNLLLQKEVVELKAKVQTQDHQINLMEQALKTAQRDLDKTRIEYEDKLRRVESVIAEQTSINETAQNQASQVRTEVARLRKLLENEERRLHLQLSSDLDAGNNLQTETDHVLGGITPEVDVSSEIQEKPIDAIASELITHLSKSKDSFGSCETFCPPTVSIPGQSAVLSTRRSFEQYSAEQPQGQHQEATRATSATDGNEAYQGEEQETRGSNRLKFPKEKEIDNSKK